MKSVCITDAPYNCDPTGSNDCTPNVQKALDDVGAAGGGEVLVPAGLFMVEAVPGNNIACGLRWPNISLRGTGQSILYCPTIQAGPAAGDGCGVLAVGGTEDLANIRIEDVTFRNAGSAYVPYDAGLALLYMGATGFTLYDLLVRGCRFETQTRTCLAIGCPVVGFEIAHNVMPSAGETGIYLAGTSLGIGGGVRDGTVHHNRMGPVLPPVVGAPGISVRCAMRVNIHDNHTSGANNVGIFFRGPAISDTTVEHNHVINCSGGGIVLEQGVRVTASRNHVGGTLAGSGIYVGGFFAPISDIRLIDNNISGTAAGYAINVEKQNVSPSNVEVRGNLASPDNAEGIATDGCVGISRVEGNTILFAAGGNGSPGMRIMDTSASVRTIVRRNTGRGHTAWGNGCYMDPACVQEGNDFAP